MDEFAQTGARQEDLFDDIQYDHSMQTRAPDDLFNDDFQPLPEQKVEEPEAEATEPIPASPAEVQSTQEAVLAVTPASAPAPQQTRGRGGGNRGRNRGRARNNEPRSKPSPASEAPKSTPSSLDASQHAPQASQPAPQPATHSSVRGDRTSTGGLRKPKLSEAELAEKMSRITLKNAALTAAHARAEADAASFAEREEQAAAKRKEERRERQQMMGEREKNRLRKLKAIGGREWDAEKPEEQEEQRGNRRGANGGVVGQRQTEAGGFGGDKQDYSDGREYLYREDRGRGRGRGRGAGRGGRGGKAPASSQSQSQAVPSPADFPDLPANAPPPKFDKDTPPSMAFPKVDKVEKAEKVDALEVVTPGADKKSWAEMME